MRRNGLMVAVGLAYVALLVGAATTVGDTASPSEAEVTDDFVDAWRRSRTETFVVEGHWRRTGVDGATLTASVTVAQRPPLQRVDRDGEPASGWTEDGAFTCEASATDGPPTCVTTLGRPSYDDFVAADVAAMRTMLQGPGREYDVGLGLDAGCYELRHRRDDRAPKLFGQRSRVCFDQRSGALSSVETDHGDVRETTRYDVIRLDVADTDLALR